MAHDHRRRRILDQYDAYYRYAPVACYGDMVDLLFFFSETYFPHGGLKKDSGRYADIFVTEVSPDRLIDLD